MIQGAKASIAEGYAAAERRGHGATKKLHAAARRAKSAGCYTVEVAATEEGPARKAVVQFSFIAVRLIPPPQARGEHSEEPLPVWVVRVWERDPPRGVAPLEWFLLTNEPITNASAARAATGWYECRWVIEVYQPECPSSAGLYQLAA